MFFSTFISDTAGEALVGFVFSEQGDDCIQGVPEEISDLRGLKVGEGMLLGIMYDCISNIYKRDKLQKKRKEKQKKARGYKKG